MEVIYTCVREEHEKGEIDTRSVNRPPTTQTSKGKGNRCNIVRGSSRRGRGVVEIGREKWSRAKVTLLDRF